jgi:hypothetical protein
MVDETQLPKVVLPIVGAIFFCLYSRGNSTPIVHVKIPLSLHTKTPCSET